MLKQTLNEYYGRSGRYNLDHVGIEIELEGSKLASGEELKYWVLHQEGSLRNGGIEYVTKTGATVQKLDVYFDEYDKSTAKAKFVESLRTSVHVHVCAQTLTLLQIYNVITAWNLIEDVLVAANGKNRMGNLFCLRNRDAAGIQDRLLQELKNDQPFKNWSSSFRYGALNFAALQKIGTLEFRFIKGLHDRKPIQMWVRNLAHFVRKAGTSFTNPTEILDMYQRLLSRNRYVDFLEYFFDQEMMEFLKANTVGSISTDNNNLSFTLVLASIIDSKINKKKKLHLTIQEDIDPITESEPKKKEDSVKRVPKYRPSMDWDDLIDQGPTISPEGFVAQTEAIPAPPVTPTTNTVTFTAQGGVNPFLTDINPAAQQSISQLFNYINIDPTTTNGDNDD